MVNLICAAKSVSKQDLFIMITCEVCIVNHYYRPQSLGQGNIFTPVCHSVHRREVVSQHALQQGGALSQHVLQQGGAWSWGVPGLLGAWSGGMLVQWVPGPEGSAPGGGGSAPGGEVPGGPLGRRGKQPNNRLMPSSFCEILDPPLVYV